MLTSTRRIEFVTRLESVVSEIPTVRLSDDEAWDSHIRELIGDIASMSDIPNDEHAALAMGGEINADELQSAYINQSDRDKRLIGEQWQAFMNELLTIHKASRKTYELAIEMAKLMDNPSADMSPPTMLARMKGVDLGLDLSALSRSQKSSEEASKEASEEASEDAWDLEDELEQDELEDEEEPERQSAAACIIGERRYADAVDTFASDTQDEQTRLLGGYRWRTSHVLMTATVLAMSITTLMALSQVRDMTTERIPLPEIPHMEKQELIDVDDRQTAQFIGPVASDYESSAFSQNVETAVTGPTCTRPAGALSLAYEPLVAQGASHAPFDSDPPQNRGASEMRVDEFEKTEKPTVSTNHASAAIPSSKQVPRKVKQTAVAPGGVDYIVIIPPADASGPATPISVSVQPFTPRRNQASPATTRQLVVDADAQDVEITVPGQAFTNGDILQKNAILTIRWENQY